MNLTEYAATIEIDEFVRALAVPDRGMGPKQYALGLLEHRHLGDVLPTVAESGLQGLEARQWCGKRVVRFSGARAYWRT